MDLLLVLTLVALTSVAAFVFGLRRLGLTWRNLGFAAGIMLESVGLTAAFFIANLTVGLLIVLVVRGLGGHASFYVMNDMSLLFLSLVQGMAFHAWWKYPQRSAGSGGRR